MIKIWFSGVILSIKYVTFFFIKPIKVLFGFLQQSEMRLISSIQLIVRCLDFWIQTSDHILRSLAFLSFLFLYSHASPGLSPFTGTELGLGTISLHPRERPEIPYRGGLQSLSCILAFMSLSLSFANQKIRCHFIQERALLAKSRRRNSFWWKHKLRINEIHIQTLKL